MRRSRSSGPTRALFTGDRWRAMLSMGVAQIWITDTVLSRRRTAQAQAVPIVSLLVPVLSGIGGDQ